MSVRWTKEDAQTYKRELEKIANYYLEQPIGSPHAHLQPALGTCVHTSRRVSTNQLRHRQDLRTLQLRRHGISIPHATARHHRRCTYHRQNQGHRQDGQRAG